tara:strand:- start:166 stop:588 length:423 start_codon:yes stop_codon:yes gene_type:complete
MGDGMDDASEEVKLWPSAVCCDCGRPFPKDQEWAKKCFLCWKDSRGYDLTKGDKCFLWAQQELARIVEETANMQSMFRRLISEKERELRSLTASPGEPADLDVRLLRDIISLCHPDKHGDSRKATDVTQRLLVLRGKMKQ